MNRHKPAWDRWAGRLLLFVVVGAAATHVSAAPRRMIDLAAGLEDGFRIDPADNADDLGTQSTSCDVNGDGLEDLVITADEADGIGNLRFSAGEAYVIYGRRGAWPASIDLAVDADVRIIGEESGDLLSGCACADVNDDGFGDLILGAWSSDSVANSRIQAGQVHIVFGGVDVPPVIDLAVDPGVILYGSVAAGIFGLEIRVGDVNGDGIADVLATAQNAHDRTGTVDNSGRAYISFGRSVWPATLDMLDESDVAIYGASNDSLGETSWVLRIDEDSYADILVAASLGDGPDEQRTNAGEVYLFYGRPVWPQEIDMAVDTADVVFFGADIDDTVTQDRGLSHGDLDGDGQSDLLFGTRKGDGPDNSEDARGEVKSLAVTGALAPQIDLRDEYDTLIWGAEEGDLAGAGVRAGDLTGDGVDDLFFSAILANGPDNSRNQTGEMYLFRGRQPVPAELDLALEQEDVIVYGVEQDDFTRNLEMLDLNGDGIEEVVLAKSGAAPLATSWIFGPVDSDRDGIANLRDTCPFVRDPHQDDGDGDGVGDLCDNCPNDPNNPQVDTDGDGFGDACDRCEGVIGADDSDPDADGVSSCSDNCARIYNPMQFDADADGIGDACDPCAAPLGNDLDGDGLCAGSDNCPGTFNPVQSDGDADGIGDLCDVCPSVADAAQQDGDGDGAGDPCDCQPEDPNDRRPSEVFPLTVRKGVGGVAVLGWPSAPGADVYAVNRVSLGALGVGSYGSCIAEGVVGNSFEDSDQPAPGDGVAYLVEAQNLDCGSGPLGHDSDELERVPSPCAEIAYTDTYAGSDQSVFGEATGTYADLLVSDDIRQVITEEVTGGNPSTRQSLLEHRWTFALPAEGSRQEFHVEGFRSSSTDFDDIEFYWSDDGGLSWTGIQLPDLPLADDGVDLWVELPVALSGSVSVRVVDSDRRGGHSSPDTVSLDELFFRTIP